MVLADEGAEVTASLAGWLDLVTFVDLDTDQVTARLIDEVVGWGRGQGWRVYRRAASVVPLPPPMERQRSVLDVACARMVGPPVVVEIDHTDRRRTVDKLVAEAAAGRIAIWLRWGTGGFTAPPAPVRMVTCEVIRRPGGTGRARLFSRPRSIDRPPPEHSARGEGPVSVVALPIPFGADAPPGSCAEPVREP